MSVKRAAIFLVAGQGKRMAGLTAAFPKCLLSVGDVTVIDMLLQPMLQDENREIVIVTGYQSSAVEAWLKTRYPAFQLRFVHNSEYLSDVNILSVELGVNALTFPERGYTIIETDVLLDPRVWPIIHQAENTRQSFWLTHGRYSPSLTGGIVEVTGLSGEIGRIAYAPNYDAMFNGWYKMVGMLSVGPYQVSADRMLRAQALCAGYGQYYMVPWITHRAQLPCVAVDISGYYGRSFNSPQEYQLAVDDYQQISAYVKC